MSTSFAVENDTFISDKRAVLHRLEDMAWQSGWRCPKSSGKRDHALRSVLANSIQRGATLPCRYGVAAKPAMFGCPPC